MLCLLCCFHPSIIPVGHRCDALLVQMVQVHHQRLHSVELPGDHLQHGAVEDPTRGNPQENTEL